MLRFIIHNMLMAMNNIEYAAFCMNVTEVHLLEWSAKVNNCVLTFDQSFVVVSNGAHCNLNNECRVPHPFLQSL